MLRFFALLTRNPYILLGVGLSIAILLLGSGLPPPENWTRPEEAKLVDLRIDATTVWHPLSSSWELQNPQVTVENSKWLSWSALFRNLLSFTSPSHDVVFTLEDAASGLLLRSQKDSTGKGGFFGSTHTASVTFRAVPPGDYALKVRIMDAQGTVLAERALPVVLTPVRGSAG